MAGRALLALAIMVAGGAVAQQSTAFTDSKTSISFQRYAVKDWSFGIALPENPATDFIGQLSANTINGYAAVSLGGAMVNTLLVCAWANGDKVVGSLRKATGYANPTAVANSSMGLYTIESGTSVNSTGWTYTFLCKGCITDDAASFSASADQDVFGYALSKTALTDTTSADATLNFHSGGYGEYAHNLAGAKSARYATWAALASNSTGGTGGTGSTGGGNGSSVGVPQNITTTVSNATYDYIVVGGGAAGLVVSQRLVESGASVLLLERGAASTFSTGGDAVTTWNDTVTQYDVPAMAYYLTTASDTSEYCLDTASQAGCLLGGSTMVNALMFVKPADHDFDDKWPTGWKWSDVSSSADSFYKRSPGYILADGQGVDQSAWTIMSGFLDRNGWKKTNALDSPNEKTNVYSHPPWLIQDGLRGGPIRSYLPLAQAKSNFKLSLKTKVVRVVRSGSAATGVEVEIGSNSRQIIKLNANGKVVLAAGALSTPRILINSGIGPTEQIQIVQKGSASVTLPDQSDWIKLPVGQNMMDHPIFTVSLTTKDSLYALPKDAFTSPNATSVDAFAHGQGLLAQSGQRLNFWTTVQASDKTKRYVQGTVNAPANNTVRAKIYLTHGITSTGVLEVTSDGSTAITTQPYLNTEADKSAILTFMKQLISMAQADSSPFTLNSTAESLISADNMVTGSHFVGTARMGASNDGSSVVDTNTRVWGTDNIYVVDASMHPDLPTGNTQAIIMVAAEHAAAKILADKSGAATSTVSAGAGSNSTASSGTGTSSSPAQAMSSGGGKKKCSGKKRSAQPLRRYSKKLQ